MALICSRQPAIEPISLAEAKHFLKVDFDQENGLIETLIKVARQAVEAYTGRCLITQEWTFRFNAGFAQARSDNHYLTGDKSRGEGGIDMPRAPFIRLVTEPKLCDGYGMRAIKEYRLDHSGRSAKLHLGSEVLSLTQGDATVELAFEAGYGAESKDVPETLKHGILMTITQLYENRTGVNDNPGLSVPMNESVIRLIKPYQLLRVY